MAPIRWKGLVFKALKVAGLSVVLIAVAVSVAAAILCIAFGVTSSNAVLYVIRDDGGAVSLTNDLSFDDADSLVFMLDASCLFSFLEKAASAAVQSPVLELTWNAGDGKGVVKDVRPDGKEFIVLLSRYRESGVPHGVFIGGDLPYGDIDRLREDDRNNSGISFYDGKKWYHIWCNLNEAISIEGLDEQIRPWDWEYLGSGVLKLSFSEVIIQSTHTLSRQRNDSAPVSMLMTRTLHKRAGEDSVILKVEYRNTGNVPVIYAFALGDEPWIGNFEDYSSGDVGWAHGRIIDRQGYVLPSKDFIAGFVDIGNRIAGEGHHYTGYANFIEWSPNPPNIVYFSNNFGKIDEGKPLDSSTNRVINLLWLNQKLEPGKERAYTVTLGMADSPVSSE